MQLSPEESQVLSDRHHYLVKASLIRKLDQAFSDLKADWEPLVAEWAFPSDRIDRSRGKIFRGENYKGFPYVLLDFPRHFSKEGVFAIRTMCWWGNEFSITLHLQGAFLQPYLSDMETRIERLSSTDFVICVNDTPWEYGFGPENYRPINLLKTGVATAIISQRGFMKISRRIGLQEQGRVSEIGKETIISFGEFLR